MHPPPYCNTSYVPVEFAAARNPRGYGVRLYREQTGSTGHHHLDGTRALAAAASDIAVLFIPGHDGDYRQVRSIAATVARAQPGPGRGTSRPAGFAFFAMDFRGELSGLQGAALTRQAAFAREVVTEMAARSVHDKVRQPGRKSVASAGGAGGVRGG